VSKAFFDSNIVSTQVHPGRHCTMIIITIIREKVNDFRTHMPFIMNEMNDVQVRKQQQQQKTYPSEKSACKRLRYVSHLLPITFPQVKQRTGIIIFITGSIDQAAAAADTIIKDMMTKCVP
jgi:hypothetical protein